MQIRKLFTFLTVTLVTFIASSTVFAQEAASVEGGAGDIAWKAMAAGLTIGLAAVGGAFAQGKTAVAALEGIARNPNAASKIFTPMILGLALIESLVIYALIIAIMIKP
jgi:F-type H+-transporting ATPase subunit c